MPPCSRSKAATEHSRRLDAGSDRHQHQVADGLTSRAFRALNELAVEGIVSGCEQVTDEAVERWTPVFDAEAAFA